MKGNGAVITFTFVLCKCLEIIAREPLACGATILYFSFFFILKSEKVFGKKSCLLLR